MSKHFTTNFELKLWLSVLFLTSFPTLIYTKYKILIGTYFQLFDCTIGNMVKNSELFGVLYTADTFCYNFVVLIPQRE